MFVMFILYNDDICFVGNDVAEILEYVQPQNFNVTTQRSMALLPFCIKETAIQNSDGHITLRCTPKCSGKGQRYFILCTSTINNDALRTYLSAEMLMPARNENKMLSKQGPKIVRIIRNYVYKSQYLN